MENAYRKAQDQPSGSLSAYACKLCAFCSMDLYGTCRVGRSILVWSSPNISASILVFLKCQKELPSLTLTGMLAQRFPAQSTSLIVWTIRICFWMLLFPLSLSDPPKTTSYHHLVKLSMFNVQSIHLVHILWHSVWPILLYYFLSLLWCKVSN